MATVMLNLQICTVIIMTKKKKKKKKSCDSQDSNPGHMSPKSTRISSVLWRPMHITDKNNQYTVFAPFSAPAPISAPCRFLSGKNIISAPSVTKVTYKNDIPVTLILNSLFR